MEKKETEWKADDSAPISTKGRKQANFRNQTTNSSANRFPWTTIVVVALLLAIVGLILLI